MFTENDVELKQDTNQAKSLPFLCFEGIKYDAAKEERHLQEAKQRELQRIEEALQLVAHRGKDLISGHVYRSAKWFKSPQLNGMKLTLQLNNALGRKP